MHKFSQVVNGKRATRFATDRLLNLSPLLSALGLTLLVACSPNQAQQPVSAATDAPAEPADVALTAPAGRYTLDKSHASLTFSVNHLGYSWYTAQFAAFDATLDFDPDNLAASQLKASIDVSSITLPTPPEGFHTELMSAGWFDADRFPAMTFHSTNIKPTGPRTATLTGELTLHGITRPLQLDVRINGGYAGMPGFDPQARLGVSATGALNRSEFGIAAGIPPAGSNLGVSDQATFAIEAEFIGPPLAGSAESGSDTNGRMLRNE